MCSWGYQWVQKVTTSIGSKQELIENSFDICTTKFKLDIFAFPCGCPVNPIDVDTLLMRGRPQAEAGHALSIYFIEICDCLKHLYFEAWNTELVSKLMFSCVGR